MLLLFGFPFESFRGASEWFVQLNCFTLGTTSCFPRQEAAGLPEVSLPSELHENDSTICAQQSRGEVGRLLEFWTWPTSILRAFSCGSQGATCSAAAASCPVKAQIAFFRGAMEVLALHRKSMEELPLLQPGCWCKCHGCWFLAALPGVQALESARLGASVRGLRPDAALAVECASFGAVLMPPVAASR